MKITDDDRASLHAIYDELPVVAKVLDACVAKFEKDLLTSSAENKEAIYVARLKLEGARNLRQAYKTTVLELSKKSK